MNRNRRLSGTHARVLIPALIAATVGAAAFAAFVPLRHSSSAKLESDPVIAVAAPPAEVSGQLRHDQSPEGTNGAQAKRPVTEQPRFVDPPGPAPAGMVWIGGGNFVMGDDRGQPDETPAHTVSVSGFWMDRTEVTNAQFKQFVDATHYVTVAERTPKREDFRGLIPDVRAIPAENLVPGSICFNEKFDRKSLTKNDVLWPYQVWKYVKGANWREPDGPGSSISQRMQHPVVHVSWDDACEYCRWAGKRLPTEAEWEKAARGGLKDAPYPWGSDLVKQGKWMLNIWQGEFPETNEMKDGFRTTAPVASFFPNRYGLFDMSGNVWEWCSDFYRPDYYQYSPLSNPRGPADSFDPNEPGAVKRVQRGGSFMCSDNYCRGYRVAARMKGAQDSGAYHTGFRCVLSPGNAPAVR